MLSKARAFLSERERFDHTTRPTNKQPIISKQQASKVHSLPLRSVT
jgi:hypothetical protein